MKSAYFEMVGGASGNMLLGALLDAGLDVNAIEAVIRTIPLPRWEFSVRKTSRRGISATLVDVRVEDELADKHPEHHHMHLADVLARLNDSSLSDLQKRRTSAVYRRLADAEAKVHGTTVEQVHFHEVGATDAIVDVAAFVVALDVIGIQRVYCSAFPVGNGSILMHHGEYPNPPPATMELLIGSPLKHYDLQGEMVTTTAAAILTTFCETPGERPSMRPSAAGYGAGHRDAEIPNVTRVVIGDIIDAATNDSDGRAIVVEANIDDMSPQDYAFAMERLFDSGAWDVWLTPILMKKSRPAMTLSALGPEAMFAAIAEAMLAHTSTIGFRYYHVTKGSSERRSWILETEFGAVRIKDAIIGGQPRSAPEHDDLLRLARENDLPISVVRARVLEKIFNER